MCLHSNFKIVWGFQEPKYPEFVLYVRDCIFFLPLNVILGSKEPFIFEIFCRADQLSFRSHGISADIILHSPIIVFVFDAVRGVSNTLGILGNFARLLFRR